MNSLWTFVQWCIILVLVILVVGVALIIFFGAASLVLTVVIYLPLSLAFGAKMITFWQTFGIIFSFGIVTTAFWELTH
jgi:hypothetical protein